MRILLVSILLLVTTACATAPRGDAPRRSSRNVLTVDEIHTAEYGNVYDLVRSQRPAWLRTRGTNSLLASDPIMVYIDGTKVGGVEILSSIPAINVEELRFFTAAEAQARFGLGNTNGAILVTTRRG